jgi:hypothetical protein
MPKQPVLGGRGDSLAASNPRSLERRRLRRARSEPLSFLEPQRKGNPDSLRTTTGVNDMILINVGNESSTDTDRFRKEGPASSLILVPV